MDGVEDGLAETLTTTLRSRSRSHAEGWSLDRGARVVPYRWRLTLPPDGEQAICNGLPVGFELLLGGFQVDGHEPSSVPREDTSGEAHGRSHLQDDPLHGLMTGQEARAVETSGGHGLQGNGGSCQFLTGS